MTSFIRDLILKPTSRGDAPFPEIPFRKLGAAPAETKPKLLQPTYSYDLAEIESVRDPRLAELDDIRAKKLRQMMDSMIPGVLYDTGVTERDKSAFIWARPVRVHPDYAPHVMAWGAALRYMHPVLIG